jgi:hypothetical protein
MAADSTTPPPGTALLHAFLNTLDLRSFTQHGIAHRGGEHLATPDELAAWLHAQGLLDAGVRASERDLARAHQLRAQLRGSLAHPGLAEPYEVGPGQGPLLTFRIAAVPGKAPDLVPAEAGVEGALARIALCVSHAVASGGWARLKQCEAPDCRWIFYDRSRPNRGRWCAPELCGNRMKTRAYRRRQHS